MLENAGLACAFFQVDTFEDYAFMMEQLCAITGREDLYEENVTQVEPADSGGPGQRRPFQHPAQRAADPGLLHRASRPRPTTSWREPF